jgi:outer membrane protein assembly factor BamB
VATIRQRVNAHRPDVYHRSFWRVGTRWRRHSRRADSVRIVPTLRPDHADRPATRPAQARAEQAMKMVEGAPGGIFLSYRREDTEHAAGRLGDRIALRFGRPRLFVDIDSIPPGADFVEAIERAVASCEVLVALIGPRWTTALNDQGARRLDDPDDFVLLELRTALRRKIPVIPVLVDGAPMPNKTELPRDLEPLTRRNAVRLDAESFTQDSQWLVDTLARLVRSADAEARPAVASNPTTTSPDEAPTNDDSVAAGAQLVTPGATHRWIDVRRSRRTFIKIAAGAATLGATGIGALVLSRNKSSGRPAPVWTFETGGPVYSSPAVDNGLLYVGSNDQNLYAIDALEGRQVWRYETGGAVTSSPMVVNGVVYVGSNDQNVHAVTAATGVRRWSFATEGIIHSSPTVDNGVLYVGSRDHNVYAVNVDNGEQVWRFTGNDWFNSSPLAVDGSIFIGCRDMNVYALDGRTGEKRWSYTTASSVDSSAAVSGSTLWIGSDDHHVYALNSESGAWIWDFDTGGGVVSSPSVVGDVLYVGGYDGYLHALDVTTGLERWRHRTGNIIRSSPAVVGGVVYIGSRDFSLYAVDAQSGLLRWQFATEAPIDDSSPLVVGDLIYIGSLDHRVYALSAKTGPTES